MLFWDRKWFCHTSIKNLDLGRLMSMISHFVFVSFSFLWVNPSIFLYFRFSVKFSKKLKLLWLFSHCDTARIETGEGNSRIGDMVLSGESLLSYTAVSSVSVVCFNKSILSNIMKHPNAFIIECRYDILETYQFFLKPLYKNLALNLNQKVYAARNGSIWMYMSFTVSVNLFQLSTLKNK